MQTPTIYDIISHLEEWAPKATAEDFDNIGLLVGDKSRICTGALIAHDTLVEVVEEAIEKKCNLIISFHPIIFSGLKSLTGKNYVEKAVLKAIENKIAIYAIHTALDNHPKGVSYGMSKQLILKDAQILVPKKEGVKKLNFYVPTEAAESVKKAVFEAGGGAIGNYSECSFENTGLGQDRPNLNANPTRGENDTLTKIPETQVQLVFESHLQSKIVSALLRAHPYQEVAYEVYSMDVVNPQLGMGMIGTLPKAMSEENFLTLLKEKFNLKAIRHSAVLGKKIETVALLGGSGSFAIADAKRKKADAYVTADLKYHDFYQSEEQLLLVDIGHYESEQFTNLLIRDYLSKKMPNFAFILALTNTNPVNYF